MAEEKRLSGGVVDGKSHGRSCSGWRFGESNEL